MEHGRMMNRCILLKIAGGFPLCTNITEILREQLPPPKRNEVKFASLNLHLYRSNSTNNRASKASATSRPSTSSECLHAPIICHTLPMRLCIDGLRAAFPLPLTSPPGSSVSCLPLIIEISYRLCIRKRI